jgi:hypothetical protein
MAMNPKEATVRKCIGKLYGMLLAMACLTVASNGEIQASPIIYDEGGALDNTTFTPLTAATGGSSTVVSGSQDNEDAS